MLEGLAGELEAHLERPELERQNLAVAAPRRGGGEARMEVADERRGGGGPGPGDEHLGRGDDGADPLQVDDDGAVPAHDAGRVGQRRVQRAEVARGEPRPPHQLELADRLDAPRARAGHRRPLRRRRRRRPRVPPARRRHGRTHVRLGAAAAGCREGWLARGLGVRGEAAAAMSGRTHARGGTSKGNKASSCGLQGRPARCPWALPPLAPRICPAGLVWSLRGSGRCRE